MLLKQMFKINIFFSCTFLVLALDKNYMQKTNTHRRVQEKFREDEEERIKSVLGEAILTEGRADNLDPILQALFKRYPLGLIETILI